MGIWEKIKEFFNGSNDDDFEDTEPRSLTSQEKRRFRYAERVKRGVCTKCNNPIYKWNMCEKHYNMMREQKAKSRMKPVENEGQN